MANGPKKSVKGVKSSAKNFGGQRANWLCMDGRYGGRITGSYGLESMVQQRCFVNFLYVKIFGTLVKREGTK